MFWFVLLLTVASTASATDDVDFETCLDLLHSSKHCCELPLMNKTLITEADINECKLLPGGPESCEKSICFGTKLGMATADGAINMDKFKKHLEEKLSNDKNMLEAIKKQCLDGRFKLFGEPDECDLNKLGNCIQWQFIFRCPNISKDESCKEYKETSPKCVELDS